MRLRLLGSFFLSIVLHSTVATALGAHRRQASSTTPSFNQSLVTTTIDNESPQIRYSGDWVLQPNGLLYGSQTNFSGGSVSYTTRRGDSFTLNFTGTTISFYGPSFITHATFNVTLDGEHVGTCHTAISTGFNDQVLLWTTDPPLEDKQHSLTITHDDLQGTFLMLDRLTFTQIAASLPSSSNPAPLATSATPIDSGTSPSNASPANKRGTIIGAVLGSFAALFLLLFLLLCLLRKHQRSNRSGFANQNEFASPSNPYGQPGFRSKISSLLSIRSYNQRRGSVSINGNKWENAGARPPRGGGVNGMVQRVRYTLEGKVLDLKRGSGTTTGTGYTDDKAIAIPHIYNSYKADTIAETTRGKGTVSPHNTLLSSGPAVPYQIPVRDSPTRSPISAGSMNQNTQLPPSFTQRPPGPYPTITRSSSLSSLQNKTLPSLPPPAHLASSSNRPHPYAPYAQDFASSVDAGLLHRLSVESQAKMSGIAGYRNPETGMWVLSRNPFATTSQSSITDTNATMGRATEATGERSEREAAANGSSIRTEHPPLDVQAIAANPPSDLSTSQALQTMREQRMQLERNHPYMHSRNNSSTSFSSYADATTADGLAQSFTVTPLARVDSWASSLRSKRYSNQLFSR